MRNPSTPTRWPPYARVPPFLPVPLRTRADGWTAERQGQFIGMLAETGLVAAAARTVGMSRMAAYRLRRSPGAASFAHSWDVVVAVHAGDAPIQQRKVTPRELATWAIDGPLVITMRRGLFVGLERKPCNTSLLRCLARFDRLAGPAAPEDGW